MDRMTQTPVASPIAGQDPRQRLARWRALGAVEKCRNIVSLCGGVPHETVLEIGAGDGAVLARLEELGFPIRSWALEVNPTAAEAIRTRGLRTLADCRVYNGQDLPFDDGAFDLVILTHVLEHVDHPRGLLREAARTGRHVFVEVPLEDTVRLRDDSRPNPSGHVNFYSPKTIRLLLRTSGLEVLAQRLTHPSYGAYAFTNRWTAPLRYLFKTAMRVCPPVATRIGTYHLAMLCRAQVPGESPQANGNGQ